jgi:hypothetical protein
LFEDPDVDAIDVRRRPLTAGDVDALLAYLPALERLDQGMQEVMEREGIDRFKAYMRVHHELHEKCAGFSAALYGHGWTVVFDWPAWAPGRSMYDDSRLVASADLATLRRLCTVMARADHMTGPPDPGMTSGTHLAVTRRLDALRRRGEAP